MTEEDGHADAAAIAALLARLAERASAGGGFTPLGPRHAAVFTEAGNRVLLVTFERLDEIAVRDEDALPFGLTLAAMHRWSQLCVLADGETGWRAPEVWLYLDRLTDGGFFESFDRVVFYGAGLAGYAAAAYSVASPGATLLLLSPRATLDRDHAAWETRHPHLLRGDFTTRYGFAPDMAEGAGEAILIHDPWQHLDAVHAGFFTPAPVDRLAWRGLGPDPETRLGAMGLLAPLIAAAAEGRLDPASASRMWRARQSNLPWLRELLAHAEARPVPGRTLRLCRLIMQRHPSPWFHLKLKELEAAERD